MQRGDRQTAAISVPATQEVLAGEVGRLVSGADWQRFFRLQSRLQGGSFGNLLLIEAAHRAAFVEDRVAAAEPSMVAGFRTWRSLGRHVVRGQRGYPILAPLQVRSRRDAANLVAEGTPEVNGDPASGRRVVGFRVVHVFDVSQTDGAGLPARPAPLLLVGAAPAGLLERVQRLIEAGGFAVGSVPDAGALGGANGVTDWASRRVLVRADMDDAARAKTLLHDPCGPAQERAGAWPAAAGEGGRGRVGGVRGRLGVRAAHRRLQLPYVTAWAGEDPAAVLAATASRVAGGAERVLSEVADLATPAGNPTLQAMAGRTAGPAPEPVVDVSVEGIGW